MCRGRAIWVSQDSGDIRWPELREAGLEYAWLRAGYGDGCVDLQFRKNADACEREGILFGVYWKSYACTPQMASREAVCCAEMMEEYRGLKEAGIVFDEESARYVRSRGIQVTSRLRKSLIEAFCRKAEAYGYRAGEVRAEGKSASFIIN